jgi:hypothetical protein
MPPGNAWAVPLAARHFPELFTLLVPPLRVASVNAAVGPSFTTSSIVTSAESAVPPFSVANTHVLPIASGVTPPSESTATSGSFALTRQV